MVTTYSQNDKKRLIQPLKWFKVVRRMFYNTISTRYLIFSGKTTSDSSRKRGAEEAGGPKMSKKKKKLLKALSKTVAVAKGKVKQKIQTDLAEQVSFC